MRPQSVLPRSYPSNDYTIPALNNKNKLNECLKVGNGLYKSKWGDWPWLASFQSLNQFRNLLVISTWSFATVHSNVRFQPCHVDVIDLQQPVQLSDENR